MKKKMIILLTALLMSSLFTAMGHATPDRAAVTGKSCGECHSGGRHMGNR